MTYNFKVSIFYIWQENILIMINQRVNQFWMNSYIFIFYRIYTDNEVHHKINFLWLLEYMYVQVQNQFEIETNFWCPM